MNYVFKNWLHAILIVPLTLPGTASAALAVATEPALPGFLTVKAGACYFELDGEAPRGEHRMQLAFAPGERFTTKEGEDEGEIEVDPDAFSAPLVSPREAFCAASGSDDHGDTFFCASPLATGRTVEGELRHDPEGGDGDEDLFVLRLGTPGDTRLWTVEVDVESPLAVWSELVDAWGQRVDQASGDAGLRLERTLRSGIWYLRLGALYSDEGSYSLRTVTRVW